MPQNLELKARCSSVKEAADCARGLGARYAGILRQTDTYFKVPWGRLKLREEGRRAELIRYVRPDLKGNRYSEFKIVAVTKPVEVKRLLSRVFGRVVVVRKRRRLFRMTGVRIHLDKVAKLGLFIEFEVAVRNKHQAQERMKVLWKRFGIRKSRVVSGSYSDLLVKNKENGIR